jgi:hypothetical protein
MSPRKLILSKTNNEGITTSGFVLFDDDGYNGESSKAFAELVIKLLEKIGSDTTGAIL